MEEGFAETDTLSSCMGTGYSSTSSNGQLHWTKPSKNWVKVNVDGASIMLQGLGELHVQSEMKRAVGGKGGPEFRLCDAKQAECW